MVPVGVMQWFEEKSGEGRVVRRGHAYPASLADGVETHARVPGARVHFDIGRQEGVERAVNVKLQPGTRTSHRHQRFGEQSGASSPDANAAPKRDPFVDLGLNRERRPRVVVVEFVHRLAAGELATARPLVAPDVVLHGDEGDVHGTTAVIEALAGSPIPGSGASPVNIFFEDGRVVVDWFTDGRTLRAVIGVAHGQIEEVWWDVGIDAGATEVGEEFGEEAPPVQVVCSGAVEHKSVSYARQKLAAVIDAAPPPVLFAKLKLLQHADPAAVRPAAAEASLDLDGVLVRASAGADTMQEAIDLLERRLRDRLEAERHVGGDERALHSHTRKSPPAHAPHPDRPALRKLAPEERRIVRHKSIADEPMTVEEALWDLDQLDYDFYLFADLETGQDALVTRNDAGETELWLADPGVAPEIGRLEDVKVMSVPAPRLGIAAAKEWLDTTDQAFVFYTDDDRGRVLYRRIDGDYGLLTI